MLMTCTKKCSCSGRGHRVSSSKVHAHQTGRHCTFTCFFKYLCILLVINILPLLLVCPAGRPLTCYLSFERMS